MRSSDFVGNRFRAMVTRLARIDTRSVRRRRPQRMVSFVAVPHLVHIYAHQRGDSFETLRRALRDANGLQKEFKFELVHLETGLSGMHQVVEVDDLEQMLGASLPQIRG